MPPHDLQALPKQGRGAPAPLRRLFRGHGLNARSRTSLLCLLTLLTACGSELGGVTPGGAGGGPSSGGSGTGPGTGAAPATGGALNPGAPGSILPARTWRLSHRQYEQSVLALVGRAPNLENFKPESGNGRFGNFSSTALVQVDLAANYYEVAKTLAQELTPTELAGLTTCPLEISCRDTFISELGQEAFRMEVPAEVQARLAEIFDLASTQQDAEAGYRALVVAILNSPLFLYRKELGPELDTTSQHVDLTPAQVAELLSFSLLDGPPPSWLADLAATGGLAPAQLPEVIAQIAQEPAFQEQLERFVAEWLEVDHFETVEKSDAFPGFAQAKPLIDQELAAFLASSAKADSGLANLLLDPVPSPSPALDNFYYSDPSAPDSAERTGVLGLGAVLASHAKSYLTSPTLRGTFVRKRFFCQDITLPEGFTPPPLSEAEALGTARTTRELYEQHLTNPSCSGCHRLTDNIGFALEAFDGAGRFRTEDNTQGPPMPLDTTSQLTDTDVDRPLAGAGDLNQALSESASVKTCFAQQAFRFYFGQVEESEAVPAVASARDRLLASDALQELVTGLFTTTMTMQRTREDGN